MNYVQRPRIYYTVIRNPYIHALYEPTSILKPITPEKKGL